MNRRKHHEHLSTTLLPHLVADPFQVTLKGRWQALWLRLIDVKAALEGRGWATTDRLVLEVRDERLPANHGRWRLETVAGDPPGTACERTDERPDLTLSTNELASVYLGGEPVSRLARIGLVTEQTQGAAERLDAALAVPFAPTTLDTF